jgi:hypothetical protein
VALLLVPVGGEQQRVFAAGFLVATGIWVCWLFVVLRSYSATTGEWAEGSTRDVLTSQRGWRVVDDIPMDGWNIDHIAVTPSAVLAVETKYRGAASTSSERHRSDLEAARRAAHSARLLLKSATVGEPAPVQAVLVLWGADPGSRAATAERGTSWSYRARPGLLGVGSSARNVSPSGIPRPSRPASGATSSPGTTTRPAVAMMARAAAPAPPGAHSGPHCAEHR